MIMPAPQAAQLESIAKGALTSAGIKGENAGDLAKALADVTAQALSMFLAQAMVMPGIPASAPPPALSGSTVGPGSLMPPPAGGPAAAQLEPLALAALMSNKIKGENAPDLAKVIAGALAQGIQLFTTQVKVAPGIAIAGLTTTAPGRLM
jgi:hypothetical protein